MNGTHSMLGKQAKALSPNQIKAVLLHLASTRNPERNRVAFLLSVKAGLRAKEVAICPSSEHLAQQMGWVSGASASSWG